jgi:hypothetical protein
MRASGRATVVVAYVSGVVLPALGLFAGLPSPVEGIAGAAGVVLLLVNAVVALWRSSLGPNGPVRSGDPEGWTGSGVPPAPSHPGHPRDFQRRLLLAAGGTAASNSCRRSRSEGWPRGGGDKASYKSCSI